MNWRRLQRPTPVDLYFEAAVAGAIPVIRPLTQSLAGGPCQQGRRNRERHHQLHPFGDGRDRRRLRRDLGRSRTDSDTRKPTRPRTSKATTPRRRQRSSRRSRSTPASLPRTCTAKESPRSPPPTWLRRRHSTARSSCSRSASASSRPRARERISARVYPALVPLSHPLASGPNGAFNAVVVEAENAGRLMFYGQGRRRRPHRFRGDGVTW